MNVVVENLKQSPDHLVKLIRCLVWLLNIKLENVKIINHESTYQQ